MVGRVLDGRYEIVARVARGGMATVYRAQDIRLTREVAVKVMHDGLGDDAEFARKFDREARAAARLSNPHVVSVFDQGVDNGRPYIVMEFVNGCTLRHVLTKEAPVEPLRALDLIEPVVHALASAHESGLVHRDVKPENVLLSQRGEIKVADFGLARAVTAQTATATQGLLIGTVSYLPPELVTNGRANKRSDIYSSGILLFEMLTGQKPHKGDTPIQVAWSHVHNDVPAPSTLVHADGAWKRDSRRIIPPYLDALVIACTRRQPALRPADGRALLELVRRARTALSQGIMDDPALTDAMRASVMVDDRDLEHTAPTAAVAPQKILRAAEEPARPVSFRERSASSPVSSRHAIGARQPVGARQVRATGRPGTPTSPVDLPRERVLWQHVGAGSPVPPPPAGPRGGPGARRAPRALDSTAARPGRPRGSAARDHGGGGGEDLSEESSRVRRPRSAITPVFPQISQDPVHKRRRGLVGLLFLLILTLGGTGYGYWYLEHGRWTAAPAVNSLTQEQAEVVASQSGFAVHTTEAYSESVAKGLVISTTPEAGTRVLKGSTVNVVVSRGPERYAMPKVVGLTEQRATEAIEASHLKVGAVSTQYDEKVAKGTVISAQHAEGVRLKPEATVDLVVSSGPKPITIPDTVGSSDDRARATLTDLGFTVAATGENHDTIPEGEVIRQTPARGTGKAGDTVTLVVSKGPVLVVVPKVTGRDEQSARTRLERSGFAVKVVYNTRPVMRLDVVAMQDPGAQKMAPRGSTVTIWVS